MVADLEFVFVEKKYKKFIYLLTLEWYTLYFSHILVFQEVEHNLIYPLLIEKYVLKNMYFILIINYNSKNCNIINDGIV